MWYFASVIGIGFAVLWIGLAIGFFAAVTPVICFGRWTLGRRHPDRRQFRKRVAYRSANSMWRVERLWERPLPDQDEGEEPAYQVR